jgi:hypothetical protein
MLCHFSSPPFERSQQAWSTILESTVPAPLIYPPRVGRELRFDRGLRIVLAIVVFWMVGPETLEKS